MVYKISLINGDVVELHNPADMPDPVEIDAIAEPWIKATIFTPDEYLGAVIKLCQDRRGEQRELSYVGSRAMVVYDLPLNEVVFDFYDRLKSISKGYASFDYAIERVPRGRPREDADPGQRRAGGRPLHAGPPRPRRDPGPRACEKMKELIPPHMFQIPIQAAIGGRIIARETVAGPAQGRDRQMLRRRHHPQAQAPRQAEGGKEAHAPVRQGGDPAGSVHRRPEDGRGLATGLRRTTRSNALKIDPSYPGTDDPARSGSLDLHRLYVSPAEIVRRATGFSIYRGCSGRGTCSALPGVAVRRNSGPNSRRTRLYRLQRRSPWWIRQAPPSSGRLPPKVAQVSASAGEAAISTLPEADVPREELHLKRDQLRFVLDDEGVEHGG